jgi:hypothetical protein
MSLSRWIRRHDIVKQDNSPVYRSPARIEHNIQSDLPVEENCPQQDKPNLSGLPGTIADNEMLSELEGMLTAAEPDQRSPYKCSGCGFTGHSIRRCPNKNKQQETPDDAIHLVQLCLDFGGSADKYPPENG